MTVRITYETADGPDIITRDDWHSDKDGFVTAFDQVMGEGVVSKINIPKERVVKINE